MRLVELPRQLADLAQAREQLARLPVDDVDLRVVLIDHEHQALAGIALSRDPGQSLMFVVNQNNSEIDIVDRQSGKLLTSLGEIGKLPGQFDQAHSIAVDSKNNLYV